MKYHILDLKTKKGDVCIWWRHGCAGYTRFLEDAGIYSQAEIDEHPNYFNNGETTKAIPVLQVDLFARKHVPVNFIDQMVNYTPDIAVTTASESIRMSGRRRGYVGFQAGE